MDVCHVQSITKGIFVELDHSFSASLSSLTHFKFQVGSGCPCNTMYTTDLNKLHQVQIAPSIVRLHDYSIIIPTKGQATLHCTHRRKSYRLIVQVITAQRYYSPLLDHADSLHMGILS